MSISSSAATRVARHETSSSAGRWPHSWRMISGGRSRPASGSSGLSGMSLSRTAKSSGSPAAGPLARVSPSARNWRSRCRISRLVLVRASAEIRSCRARKASRCTNDSMSAAAEQRRVIAVVGAGAMQALRQRGQARQVVADRVSGDLAAAARQVIGRPLLGGLPQPPLADRGEGKPAREPEDRQVPHVLARLGLRGEQRPGRVLGQAAHELVLRAVPAGYLPDARRSRPPKFPGDLAQLRRDGGRSAARALLKAVQHLRDGPRVHAVQADLPWSFDRRLGGLPLGFVERRIGPQPQQAPVMRAAVPPGHLLPPARRHLAQAVSSRRDQPHLVTMPARQVIAGRDRKAPGAGAPARPAFTVTAIQRVPASRRRARPPAQQRMPGRQREHPAAGVPSGFGQESRIGQPRQPGNDGAGVRAGFERCRLPRSSPSGIMPPRRPAGGWARARPLPAAGPDPDASTPSWN